MDEWIRLVGPNQSVEILGIKLVGVTAETGWKLAFSIVFILVLRLIARIAQRIAHRRLRDRQDLGFWSQQFIRIATTVLGAIGLISIWFDDPGRLAAGLGLFSAGLAFALQRVITAFAGYFVILRGATFNVGDRIKMGGVRGDVIGISFLQTTIMEMGQPASAQDEEPGMWVWARQYSGRIVTVTNAKIFDEPVYNYTRDFPYIWEEIRLPIAYTADWQRAEQILLSAAQRHGVHGSNRARRRQTTVRAERHHLICGKHEGPARAYGRDHSTCSSNASQLLSKASSVARLPRARTSASFARAIASFVVWGSFSPTATSPIVAASRKAAPASR